MARTMEEIRRAELAQIHIAKVQLGLDDDTYRALLRSVGRVESAADLGARDRRRVLAHMKSRGFKAAHKRANGAGDRKMAGGAEARKVRAIWLMLHDLGLVKDPSEASLAAYVKRICGVDDLHWVTPQKMERLIETMKQWALRALPGAVERDLARLRESGEGARMAPEELARLNEALSAARRGTYDPLAAAYMLAQQAGKEG